MPSPEHPRGGEHQEHEQLLYHRVARFPGERSAGRAYGQLQSTLYARTDSDLSVYRLLLDRIYHVAVLGLPPPPDLERRVQRVLSRGEPATLPPEVLQELVQRRAESIRLAPWVERHVRPEPPGSDSL